MKERKNDVSPPLFSERL